MRKYLYRMAFVVGVLLLLTGNVWAGDTYYFKVNSVTPSSTPVFEATAGKTISLNFTVRIGVLVSSDDAGEEIDGYYKGASALSWNVSETELFTESSSKYSLVGGTLSDLPSNCVVITLSEGTKTGIIDVKVVITGTLTTATEELTVNAFMASADDSGNLTQKGETKSGTITLTTDSTPTEEDFADANSKYWNGLNPPFGKKGGSDKSKPKLVTTKPRAFNAGVMDERDIRIQGSSPLVNVYIAGRDAVKLFNLDKSMKNTNIELTQDNIKKYGIPFRVTSYDITSADGKSVTSIVTIAYSGANVSYKSYPVTFALENNNTRKPIAKAVKIDVIPLVSPYWMAEGASTDKVDTYGDPLYSTTKTTTSEDEFNADVENYEVSDVVRTSIDVISEDDQGNYAVVSTDESVIYISGELSTASKDAGFTYLYVSGDQITYTVDYTTTDYVNVGTSKTITVSVPLKTTNGTVTPVTFKVGSKSGPYFITGKPDPDRVKNGLTYTLTQPKYNGKGEISQDGQVTISGKLLRVDKETKTPITFTATNPSTKAKATLKVNVIGKVAPYFDEKKVDKGYITGTKETTAGKVPSVKVKAKGSKTIYYDIPYSADLAALTALRLSFDAKKGAMIALNKGKKDTLPTSDDSGKFSPIDITVRATNDAGSATIKAKVGIRGAKPKFITKRIDIYNNEVTYHKFRMKIGSSYVDYDTEGVDIKFSPESTADTKTLDKIGLAIVNWDEIKITTQSPEIHSGDVTVSVDKTFSSGDVLSDDEGNYLSEGVNFRIVSGEVKLESVDVNYAASGDKAIASGDVYVVFLTWSGDVSLDKTEVISGDVTTYVTVIKESPDKSLKNNLILQVVNPDLLLVKEVTGYPINIVASNIGTEVVGKLRIVLHALSTSGSTSTTTTTRNAGLDRTAQSAEGTRNTSTLRGDSRLGLDSDSDSDSEGKLSLGTERTLADLTAEQLSQIEAEGLMVVAVLPEMSADEAGQYDIDADLDENAPEGAELVWLAFPRDEPSDDDKIADFYDTEGELIENVPESRKVVVSPWLREGVIYEPVIAVKVK